MSDLHLIDQLEEIIGKKLEKVIEEKFKINSKDLFEKPIINKNSYALSHDGNVIALSLKDSNALQTFPFYKFEHLVYLFLIGVELSDFLFLKELKCLQTLVLSRDKLRDVFFLKELKGLTSLDLRSNKLSDVSFLKELKGLTSLDLSYNKLSDVSFLKELKGLTSLDLSSNKLSDVSFLKELKGLTSLDLRSNKLSDVSFLKELKGLTTLDLSYNELSDVSFLKELKGLTTLDLSYNELSDVSFLKELKGLTYLDLSYNKLSDVSFLKELKGLTSLNLINNKLSDVSFLKELKGLTSLDLRSNELSDVSFLKELKGLTTLYLGFNKLSDVSFLKELKGLTYLDLRNNRIKEVPAWLAKKDLIINIEELALFTDGIALYGNPIEKPPLEVVKRGNEAILNYYTQLETQDKDYLYEAKMLIVGEGEAGKTTLAWKMENPDCLLPQVDDRTKGITINTHIFEVIARNNNEKRTFKLNVWDFGGQEIYHATHRFFLSKRSLYVLVADNRKDDTDFNYWLNIIELFAGESPMIIVLNEKGDVQRSINTAELRSRYPESIKEVQAVNFKTREEEDQSVRQQRLKEINKLIGYIEHYATGLEHIGEPLPARWVEVREAVENDPRNYIYCDQFDEICHDQEITAVQDIDTLLGYFHDLGIVLHFADNPLLRDRIILKPVWATNAVYCIFDNKAIKEKEGRFSHNDCAALWNDPQYHNMHDVLIELMKNFRLVYEIGNSGNLVAPQMLPKDTPDYDWDTANNSRMQFRFDIFMPKGIFWQFVVMMYRYIKNHNWVWRNGVILQRNGTRAEVIENLFERRIYIRFSGSGMAEFRAIIADTLDEISQSYHKLGYEKMIPCNCRICKDLKEPTYYEFSDLKTRKEKGKSTVECKKSYENVFVLPLLEGFDSKHLKEEFEEKVKTVTPKQKTRTKTIKIFLASSSELEKDREQFEIFINRKNKEYVKGGVFLELLIWEDFLDAMSPTRSQDEYNKAIADCDVFVSLFHTKVGKYTEEEFMKALESFRGKGKPLIYTYFKDAAVNTSKITPDILSLINFKQKLQDLEHFYTEYADINDLKYKFGEQLVKFLSGLTGISQGTIEQLNE
ncbi:MAG: leucine-rich repeat domain-containing protein [bacterium]